MPLHPWQTKEYTWHEDPDLSPSSSIHEASEYTHPIRSRVLNCWHSDIPQIWVDILNSKHFYSPALTDIHGKTWLKFDVRSESFRVPKKKGRMHFIVDKQWYSPGETCKNVFHHTKIEHLVKSSPTAPHSRGILEQGLYFGTQTHKGNSGVNFYSRSGDYGFWTYGRSSTGWVGLELAVNAGTKLKGGSQGRYCINRRSLDWKEKDRPDCPFIGIVAMYVPWDEAPDFLKCL